MNMLGWGNAVTILPELMYWQFGDEKALPQQYESMKKFVEAEIRKMEGRNLWLGVSLGDWLALGKDMAWQAQHNNPISNSFIVHDLKVVSETAKALLEYSGVDYKAFTVEHENISELDVEPLFNWLRLWEENIAS